MMLTPDWLDGLDDVEVWEPESTPAKAPPRPSVQCLCGRFARYLGVAHGYNGSYATETMTVDCTRCGVVTIELV